MKPTKLACHASLFILLCSLPLNAGGPVVRIGGWALTANGQLAKGFQYTGSCPVDLKFDFGLMASEPTEVHYNFTRSDGGHTGVETVRIAAANQNHPLVDEWRLGANNPAFANFRGWVSLNVEAPNRFSHRIAFTLHCK